MSEENKKEETKEENTENSQPEEKKGESAPAKEEAKEETAKEADTSSDSSADDDEEVEVPEKFKSIVESIEQMSVLDLHELVKLLEKKFGVSAAAVAVAPGAGAEAGAEAEEKSEFTVELKEAGDQKIGVIKAVKEVLGLGLKEAKELVDGAPAVLKEAMKKEEAEELKTKIEEVGGKVELK